MTTPESRALGESSSRWLAIDAARGVAMLFVCLSHFATGYFAAIGHPERQLLTDRISMIASPAFMLISGAMLGLLKTTRTRARFAGVREKLVDRGLFLLIVAHALIDVAHLPLHAGYLAWLRWGFITDTIGFCLLVGPHVVTRLTARGRLALAASLYALGWLLVVSWHPTALAARLFKDTFLGPMGRSTRLYNFPFIPWLALYLAGSALGERIARLRAAGESSARFVSGLGAFSVAVTAGVSIVLLRGHEGVWANPAETFTSVPDLLSPFQKLPPGPLYLLGYGGLALVAMGAIMWAEEHRFAPRVLRATALVGRTSLFVFVLQYYVNFALVPIIPWPDVPWWPVYFAMTLLAMYGAAALWSAKGLNRLISVGYASSAPDGASRSIRPSLQRGRMRSPVLTLRAVGLHRDGGEAAP